MSPRRFGPSCPSWRRENKSGSFCACWALPGTDLGAMDIYLVVAGASVALVALLLGWNLYAAASIPTITVPADEGERVDGAEVLGAIQRLALRLPSKRLNRSCGC